MVVINLETRFHLRNILKTCIVLFVVVFRICSFTYKNTCVDILNIPQRVGVQLMKTFNEHHIIYCPLLEIIWAFNGAGRLKFEHTALKYILIQIWLLRTSNKHCI